MRYFTPRKTLCCAAILAAFAAAPSFASETDHREFEATLHAPYTAGQDGRTFTLHFDYPHVARMQQVSWTLELLGTDGRAIQSWNGIERMHRDPIDVLVRWDGKAGRAPLADGVYTVRLTANSRDLAGKSGEEAQESETIEQSWEIAVGPPAVANVPHFAPLATSATRGTAHANTIDGTHERAAVAATGSLPYTVYYGNLHSQTNHSDGGGNLASCTGAQNPQSAALGPSDAYAYAKGKGLDFLMASEHNHMYDGSDSTNASADPATAKALFQNGLSQASSFNSSNPGFVGMYGLEWGVISNGGHMNIFNTTELLEWEYNSSNQLIGDTFVAKNDYASLYTLMRQKGWIGQFNHPDSTGQFLVNGVALGYTADGDQAMVACEVLNTSAFSTNTTETETGRSSYEGACKKALEAGYHVAFTTDQDNHCANWGASYTNRTGVLIPTGTPFTQAAMIEALKARRVFATMDKTSQLVLTANGHVMGERFNNSGSLNLVANFASTSGKTASTVAIFEGVPGRNGTATQLSSTASTTITPANGDHYYYAKITQNDGNILWSAPVWVTQGAAAGDTTAPTVSASESGSSGTITLNASASDNVAVTNVEFYVDGALKGSDATSPYSMTLNSTTLSNGSHALTAKAYDAAGNSTLSSPVSFSVSNVAAPVQLIANGGFESGSTSWTSSSGVITNDASMAAHGGSYKAWLDGYGATHTDYVYQTITIPATATTATLSFWLFVQSDETTTTTAYDTLKVQVRNSSNAVLSTLATYSNLNKGASYVQRTFDVSAWKGQTVRIYFEGVEGSAVTTSFVVDDVSVLSQ